MSELFDSVFFCLIKTAEWISDTSSVLEEECVFKADKLTELFKSKIHCGKTAKMDTSSKSVCLIKPSMFNVLNVIS